jgi:hypothetical protein
MVQVARGEGTDHRAQHQREHHIREREQVEHELELQMVVRRDHPVPQLDGMLRHAMPQHDPRCRNRRQQAQRDGRLNDLPNPFLAEMPVCQKHDKKHPQQQHRHPHDGEAECWSKLGGVGHGSFSHRSDFEYAFFSDI